MSFKPVLHATFARRFACQTAKLSVVLVLVYGTAFIPAQTALAAGTYTVNQADDIAPRGIGATCITPASTDCTLREAVIKANANPGSRIQFAASLNGTPIVLKRTGNDANASAGDLDINASTDIVGNGSSNTIIQGAADESYTGSIGDKVFGVNQDGTFNSLTVHFSGVTIRYGDNNIPNGDPTFAYTGGGVDVYQTGTGNVATFTDCVISFNRNRNSYGGGLNFDQGSGATGSLSFTRVTFDGNKTTGTGGQVQGGAMNIYGNASTVTITDSIFTNNSTAATTASGGAIYYGNNAYGASTFSIHNSDFNGNSAGGTGGAIYIKAFRTDLVVTIDQGTQIRNNVSGRVAGGSAGGSGLYLASDGFWTTTPMLVSKVTISGNHDGDSATSHNGGGGIYVEKANATIQYSRIVNNTVAGSATGTGLFKSVDTGAVTATNNWWGCSTGPSAAPCDTAVIAGGSAGSLTSAPYLRLLTTAVPSTINVGQNSAITASFLTNSAGTDVSANIDRLIGLPVVWSTVHGGLSGQQTTIQSNGMATATFTQDNTCNTSSVTAQVDNGPASGGPNTANITVQCSDLTAVKSNNVLGSTVLPTGWTWTIHIANGGTGYAAFANGSTLLADSLPNSGLTYGVPAVSGASGLTGTVTCAIDGSSNLNCTASGAVQLAAGGSFDVVFSVTPGAAGPYANPRPAGSCAVDLGSLVPESNEVNNTCSNSVTVAPAANTYVDPSGNCSGNTPCFTSPQPALNNTAVNGTVTVYGSNNVGASLTSGNSGANNVTVGGTGTLNWIGGAGALFTIGSGNFTVKGLSLSTAQTVFSRTGSGTLIAYANNIGAGYSAAYSGSGAPLIGHNYWGTNDPAASKPTGMPDAEWPKRLGAPRNTWAEGSGSATLGSAGLSGGSGTAVIVSYGRGLANAPFGNGAAPYASQMCSDYYDFFTVGGSGTWTGQVPVDSTANCNTNTLNAKKVFWITNLANCSPATNAACWNLIPSARVSISGQSLLISGLTVTELGNTPFVAGDTGGSDPTVIILNDLRARSAGNRTMLLIIPVASIVLAGGAVWLVIAHSRNAARLGPRRRHNLHHPPNH